MSNNTKDNKAKVPFVDYRQALRLVCESELQGVAKEGTALHRSLQWGYTKSPTKVAKGDLSFVWDMDGNKTLLSLEKLKNGNVRFKTSQVEVKQTILPID